MAYVDGFVLVIQKKNLAAYKRLARMANRVWRQYGALDYKECAGDDLGTECGLPFPKLTKRRKDEIVIFAYIVYTSRAHRDKVNAKVMADPRFQEMPQEMPFDMKRMSHGGFKVIVG